MLISIIAALGERNRVIGRGNDLPWSAPLKPDMKRFRAITRGKPVVMGRKTWESLPEQFRPLPQRENLVITRDMHAEFPGAQACYSVCAGLERAEHFAEDEIVVIGGGEIYAKALRKVTRLYLTLVDEDPIGDTYFPDYSEFTKVIEHEVVPDFSPRLTFLTLERP